MFSNSPVKGLPKYMIGVGWARRYNTRVKGHVTEKMRLYLCLETEKCPEGQVKHSRVKQECVRSKEVMNIYKMLMYTV